VSEVGVRAVVTRIDEIRGPGFTPVQPADSVPPTTDSGIAADTAMEEPR